MASKNKLKEFFASSKNIEEYTEHYFNYLSLLLSTIEKKAIAALVGELEKSYQQQTTIFVVGNGGSAATASHLANDIGLDVLKKSKIPKAFRVLALTDNIPVMLAIGNDDGYENLFVSQLNIHYRQGDSLIAISASGNSPNVVAAAKWVKNAGGKVIGLTGFDGGTLKELADICVHVQTQKGEYGPVEDIHMILDHLIATWLQYKMQGGK